MLAAADVKNFTSHELRRTLIAPWLRGGGGCSSDNARNEKKRQCRDYAIHVHVCAAHPAYVRNSAMGVRVQ